MQAKRSVSGNILTTRLVPVQPDPAAAAPGAAPPPTADVDLAAWPQAYVRKFVDWLRDTHNLHPSAISAGETVKDLTGLAVDSLYPDAGAGDRAAMSNALTTFVRSCGAPPPVTATDDLLASMLPTPAYASYPAQPAAAPRLRFYSLQEVYDMARMVDDKPVSVRDWATDNLKSTASEYGDNLLFHLRSTAITADLYPMVDPAKVLTQDQLELMRPLRDRFYNACSKRGLGQSGQQQYERQLLHAVLGGRVDKILPAKATTPSTSRRGNWFSNPQQHYASATYAQQPTAPPPFQSFRASTAHAQAQSSTSLRTCRQCAYLSFNPATKRCIRAECPRNQSPSQGHPYQP